MEFDWFLDIWKSTLNNLLYEVSYTEVPAEPINKWELEYILLKSILLVNGIIFLFFCFNL